MIGKKALVLLSLPLAAATGRAATVTKEYGASHSEPCGIYRYQFDSNRISADEFNRFAAFSPKLAVSFVALSYPRFQRDITACRESKAPHAPCGNKGLSDEDFFSNAQQILEFDADKIEAFTRFLAQSPDPAKPLLRYYLAQMEFSRDRGKAELGFFKTWNTAWLARPLDGIRPAQSCSAQLAGISAAPSKGEKFDLAKREWRKCVYSEFKRITPAPNKEWDGFLSAYGIKQTLVPVPDCGSTGD